MPKLEPGDTLIMHPADYAAFIGVRHTRSGRWVWRGKTYRRRSLALRRVPRQVEIAGTGVTVLMSDTARRGTAYAVKPWKLPDFSWDEQRRPAWKPIYFGALFP